MFSSNCPTLFCLLSITSHKSQNVFFPLCEQSVLSIMTPCVRITETVSQLQPLFIPVKFVVFFIFFLYYLYIFDSAADPKISRFPQNGKFPVWPADFNIHSATAEEEEEDEDELGAVRDTTGEGKTWGWRDDRVTYVVGILKRRKK